MIYTVRGPIDKTFIPYCIENGIPQEVIEIMIIDNSARFYDI